MSAISEFPSKHTGRVAASPGLLIGPDPSELKTTIHFTSPKAVTLAVLQVLLSSLTDGSPKYKLLSENCWFFCSVVLQLLRDNFEHIMSGTIDYENMAKDVRGDIGKRFAERLLLLQRPVQRTYLLAGPY
jgi:hypothetical protein